MSIPRRVGAGARGFALLAGLILLSLGHSRAQEPPNALQQLEAYIETLKQVGATDIWIDLHKPVFHAVMLAQDPAYLPSQYCVTHFGLERTRQIAGASVTCAEGLWHAEDGTQTPILVTFKVAIPGVTFPEVP